MPLRQAFDQLFLFKISRGLSSYLITFLYSSTVYLGLLGIESSLSQEMVSILTLGLGAKLFTSFIGITISHNLNIWILNGVYNRYVS